MYDLLILYNPRYQSDLIDAHLAVLRQKGKVAFGKVRVKNNDMAHPFKSELEKLYASVNEKDFLHLFITDYANLYVAKVVKITHDDASADAPSYYKDKNLAVESWFIITDMRELFRDDFAAIRDNFLSMITTPLRGNHTYAVYGNNYVYPLIIEQKSPEQYFSPSELCYKNIYKSEEYLKTKDYLSRFCFDSLIEAMSPDSVDNVISAEIEFEQNKQNPLYDFSSVIVKYSKTMERELYGLFCALFDFLTYKQESILRVSYSVQNRNYTLEDIFEHKPNLGTYAFLVRNSRINSVFESYTPKKIKDAIKYEILPFIAKLQDIRNENVHGKSATLVEAKQLRELILGIACASSLALCVRLKKEISLL